jgi:hypothetical protein
MTLPNRNYPHSRRPPQQPHPPRRDGPRRAASVSACRNTPHQGSSVTQSQTRRSEPALQVRRAGEMAGEQLVKLLGTPAVSEPASTAAIAAPATAIRRFFRPASPIRQPAGAANDLAFGIRKSPPLWLIGPDDERSRKAPAVAPPCTCGGHVDQRRSVNITSLGRHGQVRELSGHTVSFEMLAQRYNPPGQRLSSFEICGM